MRNASVAGVWLSRRVQRWAQQEPGERAHLIYQLATLAVVALLVITVV